MKDFLKGMALGLLIGGSPLILGGATMNREFARIIRHESRNDPNAVGDRGRSLGYAQISYRYYVDARREMAKHGITPPPYQKAVRSRYWSEQLMRFYMRRYCPRALATGDFETIARVHNGGANGMKKATTKRYWNQIKNTQ